MPRICQRHGGDGELLLNEYSFSVRDEEILEMGGGAGGFTTLWMLLMPLNHALTHRVQGWTWEPRLDESPPP